MGFDGRGRRSNENQSFVATPNLHKSNMAVNTCHNVEFSVWDNTQLTLGFYDRHELYGSPVVRNCWMPYYNY